MSDETERVRAPNPAGRGAGYPEFLAHAAAPGAGEPGADPAAGPGSNGEGTTDVRNVIECLLLARGGPVRLEEMRRVLDVGEAELIDAIRGVQSVHHLVKLEERRLICEVGRRPGPGRPILYGTTEGFLRYFGLKDLSQLPQMGAHEFSTVLAPPRP